MSPTLNQWIILLVGACSAGFVDSIVGGGGLLQLPTLLLTLPSQPAVMLLGTNKLASVWGTGSAAIVYNRKVKINLKEALFMAALAAVGSFTGARLASGLDTSQIKPIVVVALLVVFLWVLKNPSAGAVEKELLSPRNRRITTLVGGAAIGLYDGFIGPGTGSFLVFLLVGVVGLDFIRASATSKIVNTATNLAAILLFASRGQVLIGVGLAMGVANIIGSQLGSRLAIAKGSIWVRRVFLIVVGALLLRLVYDIISG
jgi:uncharacterized protein